MAQSTYDFSDRVAILLRSAERSLTNQELIDLLATDVEAGAFSKSTRPAWEEKLQNLSSSTQSFFQGLDEAAGHSTQPCWSPSSKEYQVDTFQIKSNSPPSESPQGNSLLAQVCLTYLRTIAKLDVIPPKRALLQQYPFALYAARFWPVHAFRAETSLSVEDLEVDFLTDQLCIDTWLFIFDEEENALREVPVPRRYDWKPSHRSALYHAAFWGLNRAVMKILRVGTRSGDITPTEETQEAFQAASFRGHTDVVRQFLNNGSKPNPEAGTDYGPFESSLVAAAVGGQVEIVRLLLETGLQIPGIADEDHPLVAAAVTKHASVVPFLATGASKEVLDLALTTALGRSTSNSHDEVIRQLLHRGADPLAPISSPPDTGREADALEFALARSSTSTAMVLLDFVDKAGLTPRLRHYLKLASSTGNKDIVEKILEKADSAQQEDCKLFLEEAHLIDAVQKGDIDSVTVTINQTLIASWKAIRDQDGRTLVQIAARKGRAQVLDTLLQHYESDSAHLEDLHTALYDAVCLADLDTVNVLLERAAVPVQSNHLHAAIARSRYETLRRLLTALPADRREVLSEPDVHGRTLLHIVSAAHHYSDTEMRESIHDTLDTILSYGISLEARDSLGRTPLHCAVAMGNTQVVELLLKTGAERGNVGLDEIDQSRQPFKEDTSECKRLIETC